MNRKQFFYWLPVTLTVAVAITILAGGSLFLQTDLFTPTLIILTIFGLFVGVPVLIGREMTKPKDPNDHSQPPL